VLWFVNSRRIFDNLSDTEHGLRDLLETSFATLEIDVIGSVAVFTARTSTSRWHGTDLSGFR
jgi:hypothetical protein